MVRFPIKNSKEYVSLNQVVRLKADRNYTLLFLADKRSIVISKTLGYFEKNLPSDFIRIHRSHIVNRSYVKYFNYRQLFCLLSNGIQVQIAQDRCQKLKLSF